MEQENSVDENQVCVHVYISGRVQGVFYRDTTRQKAHSLGINGWVKNLADGRVEVLACGEKTAIMHLLDWFWQGPARAKVDDVKWEFCLKNQPLKNFTVM